MRPVPYHLLYPLHRVRTELKLEWIPGNNSNYCGLLHFNLLSSILDCFYITTCAYIYTMSRRIIRLGKLGKGFLLVWIEIRAKQTSYICNCHFFNEF